MSSVWPVATLLAACAGRRAVASLRLGVRRAPGGCTGQVAWLLAISHTEVLTVAELRRRMDYAYSGRRVNSALQKLVANGEARVARLGNPKGYQWVV